jgi:hypothetical protein
MAEYERKSLTGTQDVEELWRKKKSPEPVSEKLRAQNGEPNPFDTVLESLMGEPSVERHAALLGDARFSHTANIDQKARMVSELQQYYGNAYVQRVISRTRGTGAATCLKRDERALREEPQDIGEMAGDLASQKSRGQPLDSERRTAAEASFGKDLTGVRIHIDDSANQLARELGVKAFTIGEDIFFQEGSYNPQTQAGAELLGHELTHVVEHGRRGRISFWGGSVHKEITRTVASTIIADEEFVSKLEKASTKMDYRVRRLAKAAVPFLPAAGGLVGGAILGGIFGGPVGALIGGLGGLILGALATPLGLTRFPPEGPEHGEGGMYEIEIGPARAINEGVQKERLERAISAYRTWKERGEGEPMPAAVIENLGDALHIAQDRGSHWEGAKGMGHDDPRHKHMLFGWSPDDPTDNPDGYTTAVLNTKEVLRQFVDEAGFTPRTLPPVLTPEEAGVAVA